MGSKFMNMRNELVSLDVEIEDDIRENEEEGEDEKPDITRQVCLKMGDHPSEKVKVEREVILRRIRHHRRVNKVKNAVRALFSSSPSPSAGNTASNSNEDKVSVEARPKWVDDAFAAP